MSNSASTFVQSRFHSINLAYLLIFSCVNLVVTAQVRVIDNSITRAAQMPPANPASAQLGTTSSPNVAPVSAHEKFATFLAGENLKSVLLLENFRPDVPITFVPSLILSVGEVPLDAVTVPAHSTATLDLSEFLRDRGYQDKEATVAVKFDFNSYASASAVVEMHDEKHNLFLNAYAQSPEEYWTGTTYDAVVWAPQEGIQGYVSVTNTSSESHVVHAKFLVNGQPEQLHDLQIGPRRTRIISIDHLLARSRKSGAGIHIDYAQEGDEKYPGAILVDGHLFNKRTGFVKYIHFMDKALPPTGTLHTHFLLLGRQPAEDLFPANLSFQSVAAVRNIDNVPVTVTPKVKFLQNGSVQTVTLPSLLIAPGESRLLDLTEEQKERHLPLDFHQGSLELTPDTNRTSIVAELFNLGHSGNYVIGPSLTTYPTRSTASVWRTDGSFQTTIMIENAADKDDQVALRLYSDRGTYKKTFSIRTGERLKVNVKELLQNAVADDEGNLLLGTSGVISLVGSHNTESKLLYDEIVHSGNDSDYIGYSYPGGCDTVYGIFLSVDESSGHLPFPITKTYDWALAGPQTGYASGVHSSDPNMVTLSGSQIVALNPPDDGQTHNVSILPDNPQEFVTVCPFCSSGFVPVLSTDINIRIARTGWGPPPLVLLGSCTWRNFACSSGTPYCTTQVTVVVAIGCPDYARSATLVVDGICLYPGITVAATGPTVCD